MHNPSPLYFHLVELTGNTTSVQHSIPVSPPLSNLSSIHKFPNPRDNPPPPIESKKDPWQIDPTTKRVSKERKKRRNYFISFLILTSSFSLIEIKVSSLRRTPSLYSTFTRFVMLFRLAYPFYPPLRRSRFFVSSRPRVTFNVAPFFLFDLAVTRRWPTSPFLLPRPQWAFVFGGFVSATATPRNGTTGWMEEPSGETAFCHACI